MDCGGARLSRQRPALEVNAKTSPLAGFEPRIGLVDDQHFPLPAHYLAVPVTIFCGAQGL